jgi:hypothetical protein
MFIVKIIMWEGNYKYVLALTHIWKRCGVYIVSCIFKFIQQATGSSLCQRLSVISKY